MARRWAVPVRAKSVLIDGAGSEYSPIGWQGGKGGHHLSGELIFPSLNSEVGNMRLVISDVYGVAERVFEWDLELL